MRHAPRAMRQAAKREIQAALDEMEHGEEKMDRLEAFKTPVTLNVLLLNGGMGDLLCALPAVAHTANQQEHVSQIIFVHDYFEEFARLALEGVPRITIHTRTQLHEVVSKQVPPLPSVSLKSDDVGPARKHLVDRAYELLAMHSPSPPERNYLRVAAEPPAAFSLKPGSYVVVTTEHTVASRRWPGSEINAYCRWIHEGGLVPVFIGRHELRISDRHTLEARSSEDVDYTIGMDLRNQTTLPEALGIMSRARAVVGVDNGLMHLAAASDVPLVIGYTTIDPQYRLPIRSGVLGKDCATVTPEANLACRFCQSSSYFKYHHSFGTCLNEDYACLGSMSAESFKAATLRVLLGQLSCEEPLEKIDRLSRGGAIGED